MDFKLVNSLSSSDQLIPQYLINTLVYFFLKTSKYFAALVDPINRKFPDGAITYQVQEICE